ncbi:uncharacterized protein ANIA_11639 [Aspergillus nidulans FGSC A4]|uniref:Uncharacterized protein n=1 Tax=Emericella nidulans (strain FGSC A4 / ATCC 38163 / CBS 112.46 / NRRL 194 / M139) TaxID=227321 RepID=C8VL02_EMENI|nr:hypothetical protein [Aspergillus nidulans FGSC A4]CBF84488.1 TPA: hypothetical protein ANIA_11639 [Aspergillus nidulans FGSC A4]
MPEYHPFDRVGSEKDPFTFILSTFSLPYHSRDLIALCKEDLTCKKLELL